MEEFSARRDAYADVESWLSVLVRHNLQTEIKQNCI